MSTATTTNASDELVGRCYTEARRFPLAVGRLASGGRIPGGPYTMTQLAVMVGGFVLLVVTRPLWGTNPLLDAAVVVAVPFPVGWTVGRVQIDHRNPLAALVSLASRTAAPAAGRLHGRPYQQRPPRRIAPVATVDFTTTARPDAGELSAEPEQAASTDVIPPAPAPSASAPAPVVSGVQALLAQRAARARQGARS
ncbi:hypothetical protein ABZ721_32240 [Streptomyces sp. NPDC006733]|uniref:hypothetical protein n=1 Tax=Streptomyces sp. NPDC006733 TaxID=3155460 RepID=UPI0033D88ABC